MTITERARHHGRRRRTQATATAAAALIATATGCSTTPNVPAAETSLGQRDVGTRERLPTMATASPQRPAPTPTRARIGTAIVITIPKVWADLVQCEAHGDWRYGAPGHPGDPGYREYEGGPNFVHSTWLAYGGAHYALHAYDATPLQQLVIARRVLRAEGVHAWPVCGPRVGLRISDAA